MAISSRTRLIAIAVGLAATVAFLPAAHSAHRGQTFHVHSQQTLAINLASKHATDRTKKRRFHRQVQTISLILGSWCDDRGASWSFRRDAIIHDTHFHSTKYHLSGDSIIAMIDGHPDVFSNFTLDGTQMTLISSVADPELAGSRFVRCVNSLSHAPTNRVARF